MPGIGGQEASRRIRALSPVHSRIPIVALASATVEDGGACVAAGMNDYLSKPLALDALRKALEHWGQAAAPSPETGVQPSPVPGAR